MMIGECRKGTALPKRIGDRKALIRVCRYLVDPDHDRHEHVQVSKLQRWFGIDRPQRNKFDSVAEFADLVNSRNKTYLSKPKARKRHPIAIHLFVAPAIGEVVGAKEEQIVAETILSILAPDSPAIVTWHRSEKRVELHMLLASTDSCGNNRETTIRKKNHIGGVRGLYNFAAQRSVEAIRKISPAKHRFENKSIAAKEQRDRGLLDVLKDKSKGKKDVFQSREAFLHYLKDLKWEWTKETRRNISIRNPQTSKIQRIRWEDILFLYHELEIDRDIEELKAQNQDKELSNSEEIIPIDSWEVIQKMKDFLDQENEPPAPDSPSYNDPIMEI